MVKNHHLRKELALALGYSVVVEERKWTDDTGNTEKISEYIIYDPDGNEFTYRYYDCPNTLEHSAWRNSSIPAWGIDLDDTFNLVKEILKEFKLEINYGPENFLNITLSAGLWTSTLEGSSNLSEGLVKLLLEYLK